MPEGVRSKRAIYEIADFGGGVQEYTSPFLLNRNQSPYSLAVETKRPGRLEKALGYAIVGTTSSSGTVTSDVNFATGTGTLWYPNVEEQDVYAQSFTTNLAGTISQVQLYLKERTDSMDSPSKVMIAIVDDNSGSPSINYTTATWYSGVTTGTSLSWVTFNVNKTVANTTLYWIVVRLYVLETTS